MINYRFIVFLLISHILYKKITLVIIMLQQKMKQFVLGQEHVFEPLIEYVQIGEAGMTDSDELRGAFLFTGPTGTGKTETAKVLAKLLNKELLRFDMSEYKNSKKFLHDLTTKLEKNSNGIILLDEIEKGNMELFDYFLQMLSEAKVTYEQKEYDFSKSYLIMTSNIGSKNIMGQENFAIAKRIVERLVKSYFRPEFLGRICRDCQICFKPLEYKVMKKIVQQKVEMRIETLQGKGYILEYNKNILPFIMNVGVNPKFGARPVVQAIKKHIRLALLKADKKNGMLIERNNKIVLE